MPTPETPRGIRKFLEKVHGIEDPRVERTRVHTLENIVTLALLAMLGGAKGWDGIEMWAAENVDWIDEFLDFTHGIPSADTFRRFFCAVDPDSFERFMRDWAESIGRPFRGQVAFDGKAVRGAIRRAETSVPLHLMQAWSVEHGLVLAQTSVEGAPGEPAAMLKMLRELDLRGATVTADANNCTKEILQQVQGAGADFVLSIKGNRGPLFDSVKRIFDPETLIAESTFEESDRGHGREEHRKTWAFEVKSWQALPLTSANSESSWEGIRTVVVTDRRRREGEQETQTRSFHISSLRPDAKRHAEVIRAHWGIENRNHWMLDVNLGEDSARIRDKRGAENLSRLRRMALGIIKRGTFPKKAKSVPLRQFWMSMRPTRYIDLLANAFS